MSSYDHDDGYNSESCKYLLDITSAFNSDFDFTSPMSPPLSQSCMSPSNTFASVYKSTLESILDTNANGPQNPHSQFNICYLSKGKRKATPKTPQMCPYPAPEPVYWAQCNTPNPEPSSSHVSTGGDKATLSSLPDETQMKTITPFGLLCDPQDYEGYVWMFEGFEQWDRCRERPLTESTLFQAIEAPLEDLSPSDLLYPSSVTLLQSHHREGWNSGDHHDYLQMLHQIYRSIEDTVGCTANILKVSNMVLDEQSPGTAFMEQEGMKNMEQMQKMLESLINIVHIQFGKTLVQSFRDFCPLPPIFKQVAFDVTTPANYQTITAGPTTSR
ncbi:hypothetical protein F5141DRAFT_1224203 [Pisolithus sp. B1]|nr:hypothetical protein F5141DRAFT_1224203 [Pisolithus sp. B1]